jgi:hypothetical protein
MDEDLDNDLMCMDARELFEEVVRLRAGIRKHRDSTGHNLCWYVPELWNLLPEKLVPMPEVPPKDEFLACCRAYRDSLDVPLVKEEECKHHWVLDGHNAGEPICSKCFKRE